MKNSKIIFLDIDGVLVTTRTFIANRGQRQFDPIGAGMLRRICEKGVSIVISSTWRFGSEMDDGDDKDGLRYDLRNNLQYEGLRQHLHADWRTVDLHRFDDEKVRGDEIEEWIGRHPETTHYAIIDDDSDMKENQMECFVHTDFHTGISYENYKQLTAILALTDL